MKELEKRKKYYEKKNVRLKSKKNSKSNVPTRVSCKFDKRINLINEARDQNGLDQLSYPKITDLIVRHLKFWKPIEQDIINYNTSLDQGVEFYEK